MPIRSSKKGLGDIIHLGRELRLQCADNASLGRLNPEKIRYLYLAEDPEIAVHEVRLTIEQHVSVATFKTNDILKIYDFAREIKSQEGEGLDNDYSLFDAIQHRFSEPNSEDAFK